MDWAVVTLAATVGAAAGGTDDCKNRGRGPDPHAIRAAQSKVGQGRTASAAPAVASSLTPLTPRTVSFLM